MRDKRSASPRGRRRLGKLAWLAAVSLTAFPGGAGVAANPLPASDNDVGLVGYDVHQFDGGNVHAVLVGRSADLGTLEASTDLAGVTRLAYVSALGNHVEMSWNPDGPSVHVRTGGLEGSATVDRHRRSWTEHGDFGRIRQDHAVDIARAAHALADIGDRVAAAGGEPASECESRTMAQGDCNGADCRGSSGGLTRSSCCKGATREAEECCDEYSVACGGCCDWARCDAGCTFGDYLCACGRTGTACKNVLPEPKPSAEVEID
jgi:hypothetical protein